MPLFICDAAINTKSSLVSQKVARNVPISLHAYADKIRKLIALKQ